MSRENLEELRVRLLGEERVQQMVQARAYEIYQVRGGQPGFEARDWFQAESEVLAFLIAHESSFADEQPVAEPTALVHASPTPAVSDAEQSSSSKPKDAKRSEKKNAPKPVASKNADAKSKTKRTGKSSGKEKSRS